mgnify:CR=1 FL=1
MTGIIKTAIIHIVFFSLVKSFLFRIPQIAKKTKPKTISGSSIVK